MTSLERLNLDLTKITDAGLEHLKSLKNLKSLSLEQTKVTRGRRTITTSACRTARSSGRKR